MYAFDLLHLPLQPLPPGILFGSAIIPNHAYMHFRYLIVVHPPPPPFEFCLFWNAPLTSTMELFIISHPPLPPKKLDLTYPK